MKWQCRDGRRLEIANMTTEHLQNCVQMLVRLGVDTSREPDDLTWYIDAPEPNGEMARLAFFDEQCQAFEELRIARWKPVLKELRRELVKRGALPAQLPTPDGA